MSQIELNKAIILHSFESYNNKNEKVFDDIIISSDYMDDCQQQRIQNGRIVETWHVVVDRLPSKAQRWRGDVSNNFGYHDQSV